MSYEPLAEVPWFSLELRKPMGPDLNIILDNIYQLSDAEARRIMHTALCNLRDSGDTYTADQLAYFLNTTEADSSAGVSCAAAAGYPSYAARHRKGEESVELRVPTGNEDNPHCWHGLDLATAKRLRHEICEAVDALDALMDYRQSLSDNDKAHRQTGAENSIEGADS